MSNKSLLKDAFVSETHAQGPDLLNCVQRIEEAIREEDRGTSVSALYITAILMQAPHLTEEELQVVVWEVSKTVCLLLAGTDTATQETQH